jgi:hypothetical protein
LKKGGERMTVFKVETYVVKPEKQEEYMALVGKWVRYIKNKEKCKELKSWKLFSQTIVGTSGLYMEMGEFESLADYEKMMNRIMQDKELQTIFSSFYDCVVPATDTISIWNAVH